MKLARPFKSDRDDGVMYEGTRGHSSTSRQFTPRAYPSVSASRTSEHNPYHYDVGSMKHAIASLRPFLTSSSSVTLFPSLALTTISQLVFLLDPESHFQASLVQNGPDIGSDVNQKYVPCDYPRDTTPSLRVCLPRHTRHAQPSSLPPHQPQLQGICC